MPITSELTYTIINNNNDFPDWTSLRDIVDFFYSTMQPWHDSPMDIERALDYVFSDAEGKGGFLVLASEDNKLVGALLMLNTGMGGYVPENLLLFVTVDPAQRGRGLGAKIIKKAVSLCKGDIKLHVEYDNPAKRLYERLGFENKYAEMRLKR